MHFRFIALVTALLYPASYAVAQWVEAPVTKSLPGEVVNAKTSFDPSFGRTTGTYRAMYESITDARNSAKGKFLVGRYRYTYSKPIEPEGGRPRYDESVTEVLLDCANRMSGTSKLTYKLKGAIVREVTTPASEVLLMQSSEPSTVADLCSFAKKRGATN